MELTGRKHTDELRDNPYDAAVVCLRRMEARASTTQERYLPVIDKEQLRGTIETVLKDINLYSESAVELLMGTAAVESKLGTYIKQIKGPALGIFQMEPATEKDIWQNYLAHRSGLTSEVMRYKSLQTLGNDLQWNIGYQIVMARVHYLRVPKRLPAAGDVVGLGIYWKKYYNTLKGKGTVTKFTQAYEVCL